MTDASAKSVWVVLLALLGATLFWLWATGKGVAFWNSFRTAMGQQPASASAPAPAASSVATGGTSSGAAALTAPPIYVTSSPTQSNISPIPTINYANVIAGINSEVGSGLNTAGVSYSAQNQPQYISTLNTPGYSGLSLGSLASLLSGGSGGTAATSPTTIADGGMAGTTPSPLNGLGQITDDPYFGTAPGAASAPSDGLVLV